MLNRSATKYTKKDYCVRRVSILRRFPYFDSSYIEIPAEVASGLRDAHKKLMSTELGL